MKYIILKRDWRSHFLCLIAHVWDEIVMVLTVGENSEDFGSMEGEFYVKRPISMLRLTKCPIAINKEFP